eukprot:GHVP01059395.1.p2 GENE.GHVP01059395.1~~GHVP01059395.1.p2  ORF type:complete len:171 (+),score=12.66 GHVP01059395.1:1501-2013(+)
METSCIFCKIINKEIPSDILYETELTIGFLDISPLALGHIIIIPKYHCSTYDKLSKDHAIDLSLSLLDVSNILINYNNAYNNNNGKLQYNILQNNGHMAGQVINHVHFHIIPKYNSMCNGMGDKGMTTTSNKNSKGTGLVNEWSPIDVSDDDKRNIINYFKNNIYKITNK